MKIEIAITIETPSPLSEDQIGDIRSTVMAISTKLQEAIDRIRETTSIVKAVLDADKVQTEQIATLTGKVTELQEKLAAGQTVNEDDINALAQLTSDIDMVNTQLKQAIPANTAADPAANANDPNGNAATGGQPPANPSSPNPGPGDNPNNATQGSGEQSVQAAEQERAKPLPGTGG